MNTQETNKNTLEAISSSKDSKFQFDWEKELHMENIKVFKKIFGDKNPKNELALLN